MFAQLLPLKGKYYGSIIEIIDDNKIKHEIKLWNSGKFEPSDRELKSYEITIEDWRENKNIILGDESIPAKEVCEICDNHFESRETYELAKLIVEKLNS